MSATAPLLLLVAVQAPSKPAPEERPPAPQPAAVAPAAPSAPRELDDGEAREMVRDLQKKLGDKSTPLANRLAAVEALEKVAHEQLVRPLAQVVQRDPAITVQRAAARALGSQPSAKARPALLTLLADGEVGDRPETVADLIRALDRAGYEPKDWSRLERAFERDFGEKHIPKQKALLALVANHKEVQAVDLLVRNLDQPEPADVHAADNPPAEYWEQRWKAWRAWHEDVRAALFTITGQRFGSAAEARAWLEKNGSRLKR
jgi:HEAT repeat protein